MSSTNDGAGSATGPQGAPDSFNAAQKLHFRVSCEYMDKMLQEIESILHSAEGASPFSRYQLNLSPAQGRVLEDYIRRFRSQILRALAWQHIELPPPNIPATRAISTHLTFIDIAISELRPSQMRGSGSISETTAAELTGVLKELSSLYENMMIYVKRELEESLQQRVDKLISEGKGSALLQRIESVVTARGFVEFRPRIDMLLSRLEDTTFEVAVFGRVSSGKSSFLNALFQMELLPVGANPITAVPTRVQYGERIASRVRFGSGASTEVPIERFRQLISEAGNPGNREGVRYALLEVPSDRLSQGIVLVDTPGLGSLALRGTQETLAYLPSCDLAIVLIDAGATLTPEDVGTLRLVQEAGITALVVLSKADLLQEEERAASVRYIRNQIQRELRSDVPVSTVSSIDGWTWMVDGFYRDELEPRFRMAHELRLESVNRKLRRLQRDVLATLESKLHRAQSAITLDSSAANSLERSLTDAAGQLGILDRTIESRILALEFEAPKLVERVTERAVDSLHSTGDSSVSLNDSVAEIQRVVQNELADIIAGLRDIVTRVVTEVTQVGQELNSSGLPDAKEILGLIRDAPRFELPEINGKIEVGMARLLGSGMVRNRLLKEMRMKVQPDVNRELTSYRATLDGWAKRVLRAVQTEVNSFADIYRASIQDLMQKGNSPDDLEKLAQDISYLADETEPVSPV